MREQELTGEEGYLRRSSPADWSPPGPTGCSGPRLSHGVLLPVRRSPASVSPGQTVLASSLPGRDTTFLQDTATHLRQLCLGSGRPSVCPRPTLPAAGTWGLRSPDGDLGGTPAAPTTRMLRTDGVCLRKFQVTEIACEMPHVPPSRGVLAVESSLVMRV